LRIENAPVKEGLEFIQETGVSGLFIGGHIV
jgi:hypothetical protein